MAVPLSADCPYGLSTLKMMMRYPGGIPAAAAAAMANAQQQQAADQGTERAHHGPLHIVIAPKRGYGVRRNGTQSPLKAVSQFNRRVFFVLVVAVVLPIHALGVAMFLTGVVPLALTAAFWALPIRSYMRGQRTAKATALAAQQPQRNRDLDPPGINGPGVGGPGVPGQSIPSPSNAVVVGGQRTYGNRLGDQQARSYLGHINAAYVARGPAELHAIADQALRGPVGVGSAQAHDLREVLVQLANDPSVEVARQRIDRALKPLDAAAAAIAAGPAQPTTPRYDFRKLGWPARSQGSPDADPRVLAGGQSGQFLPPAEGGLGSNSAANGVGLS